MVKVGTQLEPQVFRAGLIFRIALDVRPPSGKDGFCQVVQRIVNQYVEPTNGLAHVGASGRTLEDGHAQGIVRGSNWGIRASMQPLAAI